MSKLFSIYRSSAGSGKTYTLAKEYLKLALSRPGYFQHILAVTFTNKATQEMKDRIIAYLHEFSKGKQSELAESLKAHLSFTQDQFQKRCEEVLQMILHRYTNFSVSTIDTFFQKIIRAFAKERGLNGGFKLELDQKKVLQQVVDDLLEELGENKTLTHWLLQFSEVKVEDGKSWEIRKDIRDLGMEVFKEEFKLMEEDLIKVIENREILDLQVKSIQKIAAIFEQQMKTTGVRGLGIMETHGLRIDDFSFGTKGVANYFVKIQQQDFNPTKRVLEAYENTESWYSKRSDKKEAIIQALKNGLEECLHQAVDHYSQNHLHYFSAKQILNNFYTYGILMDLTRKIREYKDTNDVMLISDAAHFLHTITEGNDSPFIYEKVGAFYNHFLIDEFQDTSGFQWENFKPLVENSLSEGFQNVIVGDVKQSIYRWRGGDWQLLLEKVTKDIPEYFISEHQLDQNFRSKPRIVHFNNLLFESAAKMVKERLDKDFSEIENESLRKRLMQENDQIVSAYQHVKQSVSSDTHDVHKGYIALKFINDQHANSEDSLDWKEEVNRRIPSLVEELQDQGIKMSDVAVLVRKSSEGNEIARFMLDYQQSEQAKSGYNYKVISSEALFLEAASTIQLLINILKYLLNQHDQVATVSMVNEYQRYILNKFPNDNNLFSATIATQPNDNLPPRFVAEGQQLTKLPLFELIEELIQIFSLDKIHGELSYLQAFQDQVIKYSKEEKGDLHSFLAWWSENASNLSIQVPMESDALQVLTMHKSKGLQFKVVIIPYLNWELETDQRKNNIIWAKTGVSPFDRLGYFPLKYGSKLKSTIYTEDYCLEKIKGCMDNLNLLYVAFTRAKEGLIAFGKEPARDTEKNIGQLVYGFLNSHDHPFEEAWNGANFTIGKLKDISPHQDVSIDHEEVSLSGYQTFSWRKKMTIKKNAHKLTVKEDRKDRIEYGLLIHDLLARIKHKFHLPAALEELMQEGVINQDQRKELFEKVNSLFKIETINSWFTTDWEVKTEVPILPKSGEMRRLDRVMLQGDRAIIVDFKTGEQRAGDRDQVAAYRKLLSQMGFSSIQAFLLYIEDAKILEIT